MVGAFGRWIRGSFLTKNTVRIAQYTKHKQHTYLINVETIVGHEGEVWVMLRYLHRDLASFIRLSVVRANPRDL